MREKEDLTGCKFNLLTVKSITKDYRGRKAWICICDCGTETIASPTQLKKGGKKSCGCQKYGNANKKHGGRGTRLYSIWKGIRKRVNNKNAPNYLWYGGKGIRICEEWNDFILFREWALSNGYDDTKTIDRIDSNKDYSPNNCRWATKKEQANNKTSNRFITYRNKTQTAKEWADETGIYYNTIIYRLNANWDLDEVFSKPDLNRTKKHIKGNYYEQH